MRGERKRVREKDGDKLIDMNGRVKKEEQIMS